MRVMKRSNPATSKIGCVIGELRARFDLVLEAAQLGVGVLRSRIDHDADVKRSRPANRLAADVESAIEPRDHIGQADRIDVEHRRRVWIVADASRDRR